MDAIRKLIGWKKSAAQPAHSGQAARGEGTSPFSAPVPPSLVAHADWGANANKRWMTCATRAGDRYQAKLPEPVGDLATLLRRLRSLELQHLGFQRATFGTWKTVVEYFGKQTRILLEGDADSQALCADLFDDSSLRLPETLSRKELVGIIERTNTARNDWKGHGGVLGPEEAKLRHELLLTELQRLREAMADVWADIQLIQALHTRARRGLYENEVALMMGINSEFLKVNRPMPVVLDVDRLYLTRESTGQSLPLLPLVRVGPSPNSAMNACYFFNRLESDGARFVSYHFAGSPELRGEFEETRETITFLSGA